MASVRVAVNESFLVLGNNWEIRSKICLCLAFMFGEELYGAVVAFVCARFIEWSDRVSSAFRNRNLFCLTLVFFFGVVKDTR